MPLNEDVKKQAGRPLDMKKRSAIVESAGDLFMANGLSNTSMDEVAAKAGVSKQTVYRHFSTKMDLFAAVIGSRIDQFQLGEGGLRPYEGDPRLFFTALADAFVNLMCSNACTNMQRLIQTEGPQHPNLAQLFYQEGPERISRIVSTYLKMQHDRGIMHVPDPDMAVEQFLSMLKGKYHSFKMMGLETEVFGGKREAYIKSCVDMFLQYYGKGHANR